LGEVNDKVVETVNRTLDRYKNTFSSQTILEVYPQVFSWLELLDLNVWIILGLMVALAGITMISGLLIIILERTQMIGLLKAMGAQNSTIRNTFLWFSVFIIGRGLLWGNLLGIGLVLLQQYTGIVTLDPQTYYVNKAPMELSLPLIFVLNVTTMIICVLVLVGPSYMTSRIKPASAIRYE
jgi:lipoprotein-releasing system permease protein